MERARATLFTPRRVFVSMQLHSVNICGACLLDAVGVRVRFHFWTPTSTARRQIARETPRFPRTQGRGAPASGSPAGTRRNVFNGKKGAHISPNSELGSCKRRILQTGALVWNIQGTYLSRSVWYLVFGCRCRSARPPPYRRNTSYEQLIVAEFSLGIPIVKRIYSLLFWKWVWFLIFNLRWYSS